MPALFGLVTSMLGATTTKIPSDESIAAAVAVRAVSRNRFVLSAGDHRHDLALLGNPVLPVTGDQVLPLLLEDSTSKLPGAPVTDHWTSVGRPAVNLSPPFG